MTRKVTIFAVVGFVALGMLSISAASVVTEQAASVQNETNQTNETVEEAEVTIENQTSNGSAVTVNSTTLPDTGFLVVYNATLAEPLGNSSSLESGSQEDVNVTLNQTLTENTTVLVAAFQDTDGNDQFDLGTDEIFLSDGEPVIDAATVNVTDAENVTVANETTPTPENETALNETDENVTVNETDENETVLNETDENETDENDTLG